MRDQTSHLCKKCVHKQIVRQVAARLFGCDVARPPKPKQERLLPNAIWQVFETYRAARTCVGLFANIYLADLGFGR